MFDSNGFESPTYSTGNLVGQNGWDRVDSESPSVPNVPITVQNSVVASGSQAVQITSNSAGPGLFTYAIQPISLASVATSGTPEIKVQWDMRVNSSLSPAGVWGVQVYDNSGGGGPYPYAFAGVGPVGVATNELLKVSAPDGDTAVAMPPVPSFDTFHTYVLDMNFQQGLYSLSVDGDLRTIGALNISGTNGNLGEVDFFTFNRGSDTAFFDNLIVTSGTGLVPEPASLGLIGVAGAMLLGRRRRKA